MKWDDEDLHIVQLIIYLSVSSLLRMEKYTHTQSTHTRYMPTSFIYTCTTTHIDKTLPEQFHSIGRHHQWDSIVFSKSDWSSLRILNFYYLNFRKYLTFFCLNDEKPFVWDYNAIRVSKLSIKKCGGVLEAEFELTNSNNRIYVHCKFATKYVTAWSS